MWQKYKTTCMLHSRPRKAKNLTQMKSSFHQNMWNVKQNRKKHWPGFCVCKRNSLSCYFLDGLLKKWQETLGEQTPSFFIYQELLKWKLLPWIINSTQGIKFCSLYILSIVDLCWGTNQETKPGLSPGHVNYFTEDKGDLFSWLIIKLRLVHRHYFCLLEFVGLTQTHWGRLGLISKSNFI